MGEFSSEDGIAQQIHLVFSLYETAEGDYGCVDLLGRPSDLQHQLVHL